MVELYLLDGFYAGQSDWQREFLYSNESYQIKNVSFASIPFSYPIVEDGVERSTQEVSPSDSLPGLA